MQPLHQSPQWKDYSRVFLLRQICIGVRDIHYLTSSSYVFMNSETTNLRFFLRNFLCFVSIRSRNFGLRSKIDKQNAELPVSLISCSRHRTTKFPNFESPIFCLLTRSNSRARHSAIHILKPRNLF